MHLKRLRISNFRALENIDIEFDGLVNVIIGPNAVGKTTVLEAIRLAKAVLAARTSNEANQTLISLGITSPHMPQRLFPNALTHDASKPTTVKATFVPCDAEMATIEELVPQLVPQFAQQSIGLNFANPGQAMAFFASPAGQAALQQTDKALREEVAKVRISRKIELNLTIDFQAARISGEFPLQQSLFAALEQRLPPTKALFSYFPADRALPIGEQPVQRGLADTSQQLESYNSQPQIKYGRLKHTIFSSIISGEKGREIISKNFKLIFDNILRGRELGEIGINEIGMLSIPIIDKDTGAVFDIDGLSSGEKGLILTFLLIASSVAQHGLVLLDEPELHLNPAVCRDVLQFFVDEYAKGQNIQAIICSHSAEILAGAFERDECSLFHLRSGTSLAKVRQSDRGEIRDALRRLGSSESEALLYRGTISVEGIHDVEVLRAGFDDILRRYKLKELGGRQNIEKDIQRLQKTETDGEEIGFHYFIFDLDAAPTGLGQTDHVRHIQWHRRCLENYLLDVEIITDLSREREWASQPFANVTEARDTMKRLALRQVSEQAARGAFKELGLEAVSFDMSATRQHQPEAIAAALAAQIESISSVLDQSRQPDFLERFGVLYQSAKRDLESLWDEKWKEDAMENVSLTIFARRATFAATCSG